MKVNVALGQGAWKLDLARLFSSVGPPHQLNQCILHSIKKGRMAWMVRRFFISFLCLSVRTSISKRFLINAKMIAH